MTNTLKITFEAYYPLRALIEEHNLNVTGNRPMQNIAIAASRHRPSIGQIREGYETLLEAIAIDAAQDSDIDVQPIYALIAPAFERPHSYPITQDELVAGSIPFDRLHITNIELEDFDFIAIPADLQVTDAYAIYNVTALVHLNS